MTSVQNKIKSKNGKGVDCKHFRDHMNGKLKNVNRLTAKDKTESK